MKKKYRAPKSIAIDLQVNRLLADSGDMKLTNVFGGNDDPSTSDATGDANIRTSSSDDDLFDWNF